METQFCRIMSNPNTYRKTALILTALMVLMPMIQMIEAPTEIEKIVEEKTSARAVTGTLTDSFEQTNEGEASGWVQAEGLDNTASYSLAWSVEADSVDTTVTEGLQTLSTGVSNATIPINTASLVDYETYCLNATLTSGSDTIDSSSTCLTIYPEVGIGGPELSVEIWGWDDGTAEAIIDIDNLAGVETYTLYWELLAGNEESIADSGSEDLTGQLSTIRSNSFTGLADDYHCLEVILSLDGDEVADAWDCFTAVMAGTPEASAHIEDADFGEMEVRALVWNLTSGDEYKVDITVEDTTFAIISLSETHEFNAISPAWNQESSFEQLIPGEYQVNLTVEDITNGGLVAEWNDTFTMESIPIGPPGASFNISDVGDGRISATLDLWNLSTGSTYELVWNQTSDWVGGANGSLSWEAAAHNISFAAFNAGPMPKGVYHWVVQAYVDNYHMATFYPTVSVTSQSPWSPDVGMKVFDDGFGGADTGLYGWNLEAGEEYQLDWELANADGTPMQGDSVTIVPAGPVHTENIDIAGIGKGEYLLTASLSDAENWYSSAGSIFEITTDPPYVDTDGDGIPDITDQCDTTPQGSTVDGNGCSASQGVWDSAYTIIDRASVDKALGIDVGDSGNYAIGGVTRESDGPSFDGFVDLGAYNDDTCAVHTNGSITCWGDDNTLPFVYKEGDYVEVELGMGNPVSDSSGDEYRDTGACALDDIGTLECWNLGTFSTTKSVPTSGTFISLAGGQHFCAVSSTSTIECWGPDNSGESSDVPLWNNFSSVSTGYKLTCAITTDKHAECWGITSGETTAANIDPASSLNEDKYLSIGASTRRACAILIDRSIECYGRGHFGAPATPPAGVFKSIVSNAETINHNVLHKGDTSGASQSIFQSKADIGFCAISTDGNLSCWGGPDNIFSTISYDGRPVTEVQVGSAHVCTIDDLGDAWCSNYQASNTCDTNHVSSWSPQDPRALCLHDGFTTINAGEIYHSPSGMHQNDMDFTLDADRLITGEEYRVTLTVDTDGVGGVDQMLGDDTFVAGTQAPTSHTHAYDGNGNAGWADGCYDVLVTLADSGSQNGDSWYFTLEVGSAGCIATSGFKQQMSDWSKPITGEATGTTLSTYDDGFIQYYDDSGTLLWSQLIVGNQNETVSSVAIDSENNVIACGFFWGSADFGDGVQYSSTKFADGFVAKYTQSGTLLWIEKISSGSSFWGRDFDACNSVAVDSEDNIIIGGTYFTYNLPTVIGSMTAPYGISETGFVARLDSDGTTEWISSHANFTNVRDVAVGANGDIAIAGDFSRTIEIGGKSFTKSTSGPGAFVAKVDGTTGMLLWTDAVMGASWLYGTAVALTATGEVYFSGQGYYLEFSDGDSVDPGNGHDVYVIKYTENGDMIWKRYFGSDANDGANDLVTDEEGGVLVVGTFGRWIEYGNGQSFGGPWGIGMDVYVARLGPNGDFSWFRNGGGTVSLWRFDGDVGTSMDFGPDGTLHVVGHHFYNASFGDHDIGTDQGRAGFHATMTFDTDGDGVHDSSDSCSGTIPAFAADIDGCAPYQLDSDGDGITNNLDQCPGTLAGMTVNGLGCEPPLSDESPTCSMFTTTTLGQVEIIGVPMETKPEWESLNYQRSRLSEGVYDVGLHCVDPNGDEFSLELVGPVESVQGTGSDVWIVLTDELMKGYETVHRFDYTWTQETSQESGYAHLVLIDPAMATNATKRVALWGGKVNQHWDVDDLEWKTDPDGTSGANIGALATCKKWYPDTAAVELMQHREIIIFWTAGNSAPYETTKPIWECVADDDPRVLSGALQSGEAVDASTGTILATIILTTAACGIGAIVVGNRKGGKVEFEDEDEEDGEEGENKDTFIK